MAYTRDRRDPERRQNRRVMHCVSVGLAIVSGPFGFLVRRPRFGGFVQNESMAGLDITAELPVPAGAHLKIWMDVKLDGCERSLTLRGKVVRTAQRGPGVFVVGVRLDDKPERVMRLWRRVVVDDIRRSEG